MDAKEAYARTVARRSSVSSKPDFAVAAAHGGDVPGACMACGGPVNEEGCFDGGDADVEADSGEAPLSHEDIAKGFALAIKGAR